MRMLHLLNRAGLATALTLTCLTGQAAPPAEGAIKKQLALVETFWAKKDATALVKSLYTEKTEITGEGTPEVYKGYEQLTGLVKHLMEGSSSTKITLNKLVMLGNDHAWTWVTWDVAPASQSEKPFKMKSLFVWSKTQGQWRIVADMYATGSIPE